MKLSFATPGKKAAWIAIKPSQIPCDIRDILADRLVQRGDYAHICPLVINHGRREKLIVNGFPSRIVAKEKTLESLVEAVIENEELISSIEQDLCLTP